jgi:hypothetical protein
MSFPCDRDGNVTSVNICVAKKARISSFLPKKLCKKMDKLLLEFFTHDYQPFLIVENRKFVNFITVLNPLHNLMSKKTISPSTIPCSI